MAVIAAILRAQWLSIRNARGGVRGAALTIFSSTLWYGFWTALAVGAFWFTSDPESRGLVEMSLPRGLGFVVLYWQLAPILVASLGASLDLKKLLVYPIPQSQLFWVEVLLRLSTGIEMILVLSGSGLGLMANPQYGGWGAATRVIPAWLAFAAFNLLLAAGMRSLIERLLSRKGLRELLVLTVVIAGALPQLLVLTGSARGVARRLFADAPHMLWPWSAAGRIGLTGHSATAWLILAAWIAAGYAFGRWQFSRSLRFDAQAAEATVERGRARTQIARWTPLALLPDPIGAIVEKEFRSLMRTPRFRLVFMMGFTFGLVVWLPLAVGPASSGSAPTSGMVENFLTVVCVYSLTLLGQVSYWNAFGFDRSAVQIYYVAPVSLAKTLIAKNLAAALFILLEVLAVTTACLMLKMNPQPVKILEAFLVTPRVGLFLLSAGNLSSVHTPRAMSPERVAHGGGGRPQALMLVVYPLAVLPVLLAYAGRYAFHTPVAFWVILAIDAAIGAVVYKISLDSAVKAGEERRELIVGELSRSSGPVAAG